MRPKSFIYVPVLYSALAVVLCSTGSAQSFFSRTQGTFPEVELYVIDRSELVLRQVMVTFEKDAMVIDGVDKRYRERTRLPFSAVKSALYENSKFYRWKAGLALGPGFLVFKGKKHWFTIAYAADEASTEELVFRLDKTITASFVNAFQTATGLRVHVRPMKR